MAETQPYWTSEIVLPPMAGILTKTRSFTDLNQEAQRRGMQITRREGGGYQAYGFYKDGHGKEAAYDLYQWDQSGRLIGKTKFFWGTGSAQESSDYFYDEQGRLQRQDEYRFY